MQYTCNTDIFGGKAEYGTPYAEFEVKGCVTDVSGNPITGIAVTVDMAHADSAFTAQDGTYVLRGELFSQTVLPVVFDDVDGELNGGKFAKKTVDVTLERLREGDGRWDMGDFGADNVNVQLEIADME